MAGRVYPLWAVGLSIGRSSDRRAGEPWGLGRRELGCWERATTPITTTLRLGGDVTQANLTTNGTRNWDWAIYSQGTVDILEWLSLIAGLGYTEEKKGADFSVQAILPVEGESMTQPASAIHTAWTPMATLALTPPEDMMSGAPLDHLMGYFTFSRGFRGGGFNAVLNPSLGTLTPFEPENPSTTHWSFRRTWSCRNGFPGT
ncbi:MAG: TonB-dependent receptor [Candidatus Binatia bacterium]|nr:TonB-dependent receptor [Candidatus Binatia bacterium]